MRDADRQDACGEPEAPFDECSGPYPAAPVGEYAGGEATDCDLADIIHSYLDGIGRWEVLPAAEERTLARRQQSGEGCARATLIMHNLKLVVHMAKRYRGRGFPLPDLIQEGNPGLMHALERFDPDRGARRSTYAGMWICQSRELALMKPSRTIRIPVHAAKLLNRCVSARRKLEQQGLVDAGADDIARTSGIPEPQVQELLRMLEHPVSLDLPVAGDSVATLRDTVPDEFCRSPEEIVEQADMQRRGAQRVESLPEPQRRVIARRFGLGDHEQETPGAIARALRPSAERVRQIQIAALERLAADTDGKGLRGESVL